MFIVLVGNSVKFSHVVTQENTKARILTLLKNWWHKVEADKINNSYDFQCFGVTYLCRRGKCFPPPSPIPPPPLYLGQESTLC